MINKPLRLKIIEKFDSQANFAMAAGEREDIVSRTLNGRVKLLPEKAKRWADLLKCDLYLLEPVTKHTEHV